MKRRKNADERLRKLERAVAGSGSYEDVAAYWRACLAANMLPAPTGVLTNDYLDSGYSSEKETCWVIEKPYPKGEGDWWRQAVYLTQKKWGKYDVSDYENRNYMETKNFDSLEKAQEAVKPVMRRMLEKVNPRQKRRNADDRLRAAQRIAETTLAPDDIAQYWVESIRAGVLPKPGKKDKLHRFEVWTLYPNYSINEDAFRQPARLVGVPHEGYFLNYKFYGPTKMSWVEGLTRLLEFYQGDEKAVWI